MAPDAQRPARHVRQSSRIASFATGSWKAQDNQTLVEKLAEDDETIKYIKRILCVPNSKSNLSTIDIDSKALQDLLPPLTSSNEIDLQLYALIAVILSQFVQTWYNKITPDQDFVAEIIQIVAHCTRGLEQRLRNVDFEDLLLDELPTLAEEHFKAVRTAISTTNVSASHEDARGIYHVLRPHVALDPPPGTPEAATKLLENETAWSRLVVDRILPILLPPEDLQNPCLQVLVSDIFAEMVVRNGICGRASENWLIWEGITKIVRILRSGNAPQPESTQSAAATNRLQQFGLLASDEPTSDNGDSSKRNAIRAVDSIAQLTWLMLQYFAFAWSIVQSFAVAIMHASSIPARSQSSKGLTPTIHEAKDIGQDHAEIEANSALLQKHDLDQQPIVSMRLWSCISLVVSLDQRMPWLSGILSLLQWLLLQGPGKLCQTNHTLDRLMSFHIRQKLLNDSLLPILLQTARNTLFPNNALAPPRHLPDDGQTREIKEDCAKTIVDAVPSLVRERFFATKDVGLMRQDVNETFVELFSDSYINKHLILSAVELVVIRTFPELEQYET